MRRRERKKKVAGRRKKQEEKQKQEGKNFIRTLPEGGNEGRKGDG